MQEFKGAKIVGNKIILTSPMSEDRFQLFVKNWYGSKIPFCKPVGYFCVHGIDVNSADDNHYDDIREYDFVDMLTDYIPVTRKTLPGAYTTQQSAIEFDVSVDARARFRDTALVSGRISKNVKTISPFDPSVDINDIIQVFAKIDKSDLQDDGEWLDLDKNRGDVYHEYLERYYKSALVSDEKPVVHLPERLKVKYSDFLFYGYDTWKLTHKENPMCLVNKEVDILFKHGGRRNRLRTPVIICYRGTGEMDASKVMKELFTEPIREFVPFEHVRFNLSQYININMGAFRPGSNEIPIIFTEDVNREALEIILNEYGEDD